MRRKIKLAWIENETSRKASFKKRRAGLLKKVRELTTLCDISACLIIYAPGELYPAAVWPNEDEARQLIRRFRLLPEMERAKKMVSQEEYLKERASKMAEQLRKLSQRNGERTASSAIRRIEQGVPLEEFETGELVRVAWILEDKMREIDRRIELFRQSLPRGSTAGLALPPPTEEEISGRQEFSWDWFFGPAGRERPPDCEEGDRVGWRGFRAANEAENVGFRPYDGNENGNRSERNNMGFQPYIASGSGISELGLSHKVSFEGNCSQEIEIGGSSSTTTTPLPNTNNWPNLCSDGVNVNIGGNSERVGYGVLHSQGEFIGVNKKTTTNYTNTTSVSVIHINNDYNINGGVNTNEGGNGNSNSGLDEIGESMASRMVINVESSSSGTSGDDESDDETPQLQVNKYWPSLFSPKP